ncbi:tRNA (adenosine(37)-N6)-threonylcarbamoyltransferase complex dimerization subunit type 1 TsaB [Candidatus Nanosynbacter featherlites]|uniref:tRNA (Adenosine(37)-N6)-threonylcarbamoyltransferase complex dimerization subunit type 1 TsaB n=2 Tax=Candidatus Nanosynbacter featherlites TaxID=2572088 RepID=A0A4P9A3P0_9BACT|nr:tRNA (adenosine(37)-N6)-threonylcarbamoyltransferase complex dimerization subunit type 1 TsaB [Candidatus Nanosynbacter featherlites]
MALVPNDFLVRLMHFLRGDKMLLLLDTSNPVCYVTLVGHESSVSYEWQADRTLAKGLLGFLRDSLAKQNTDIHALTGIGVMKGPGSFTGLRIGLTVANTLADGLQVPIVGATGENWQERALEKLRSGEDEKIVLPEYGSAAHITAPKK